MAGRPATAPPGARRPRPQGLPDPVQARGARRRVGRRGAPAAGRGARRGVLEGGEGRAAATASPSTSSAGSSPGPTCRARSAPATTSIVDGAGLTDKVWFPRALLAARAVPVEPHRLRACRSSCSSARCRSSARRWASTCSCSSRRARCCWRSPSALRSCSSALHVYFRDVRFLVQAALARVDLRDADPLSEVGCSGASRAGSTPTRSPGSSRCSTSPSAPTRRWPARSWCRSSRRSRCSRSASRPSDGATGSSWTCCDRPGHRARLVRASATSGWPSSRCCSARCCRSPARPGPTRGPCATSTAPIEPGETVGVLGRNGAGKTTLLRLLAGVTRPSRGASPSGAGSPRSSAWASGSTRR